MHFSHFWTPFLTTLVLASTSWAQDIVYDAEHNATGIVGTWSSGSRAVRTGLVRPQTFQPPQRCLKYDTCRILPTPPAKRSITQERRAYPILCEHHTCCIIISVVECRFLPALVMASTKSHDIGSRGTVRLLTRSCNVLPTHLFNRLRTNLHNRNYRLVSRQIHPKRQRLDSDDPAR
jgi:hypothetical protein